MLFNVIISATLPSSNEIFCQTSKLKNGEILDCSISVLEKFAFTLWLFVDSSYFGVNVI